MIRTILAIASGLIVLGLACSSDDGEIQLDDLEDLLGGGTVEDVLIEMEARLVEENAENYTFGCVDVDGEALEGDWSAEAIAAALGATTADYWDENTLGAAITIGDSTTPGWITLRDPDSRPTDAKEFYRLDIDVRGPLVCLAPR